MEAHLTDITRVIQLAVAPVFLLTAIATMINALNVRLGRIVDRRRVVQERADRVAAAGAVGDEITMLKRRSALVYYAIFCAVLSALLVCMVVAALFLEVFLNAPLMWLAGILFTGATVALVVGLALFLREVHLATQTVRIPRRAVSR